MAQDECEEKDAKRHPANVRREKELRRRFKACRQKLEATNWNSGQYKFALDDSKKALDLLEKAEKRYWSEFKYYQGDKEKAGFHCIFTHPDNVYEKSLNDLWKAELAAGIIPPVASDDCAKKDPKRLTVHQGGEQDLRSRFIDARKKLHGVDWNAAGMVAIEHAKEAHEALKKAEKEFWRQFRHYEGNRFRGRHCIYAPPDNVYHKVLPKLIKAEEEVNDALGKASQTTQVRKDVKGQAQAKKASAQAQMAQLQQARKQFDLGPMIQRPQPTGFFAWISSLFG
jgi:hypothetical protein